MIWEEGGSLVSKQLVYVCLGSRLRSARTFFPFKIVVDLCLTNRRSSQPATTYTTPGSFAQIISTVKILEITPILRCRVRVLVRARDWSL